MARAEVGSSAPKISINIGAVRGGAERVPAVSLVPKISSNAGVENPSGPRLTLSKGTSPSLNKHTVISGFGLMRPTDSSPSLVKSDFSKPGVQNFPGILEAHSKVRNFDIPVAEAAPTAPLKILPVIKPFGIEPSAVVPVTSERHAQISSRNLQTLLHQPAYTGRAEAQDTIPQHIRDSVKVLPIGDIKWPVNPERLVTESRREAAPIHFFTDLPLNIPERAAQVRREIQVVGHHQEALAEKVVKKVLAQTTTSANVKNERSRSSVESQPISQIHAVIVPRPYENPRDSVLWISRLDQLQKQRKALRDTADSVQTGTKLVVDKKDPDIKFSLVSAPIHVVELEENNREEERKKKKRSRIVFLLKIKTITVSKILEIQKRISKRRSLEVKQKTFTASEPQAKEAQPKLEVSSTQQQQKVAEILSLVPVGMSEERLTQLTLESERRERNILGINIFSRSEEDRGKDFYYVVDTEAQKARMDQLTIGVAKIPHSKEVNGVDVIAAIEKPNAPTTSAILKEEGIIAEENFQPDGSDNEWRDDVSQLQAMSKKEFILIAWLKIRNKPAVRKQVVEIGEKVTQKDVLRVRNVTKNSVALAA